jgi:hypothetical protein
MGLDSLGEGDAMFLDVDRDSSQPGSSDAPSLGELLLKQGAF